MKLPTWSVILILLVLLLLGGCGSRATPTPFTRAATATVRSASFEEADLTPRVPPTDEPTITPVPSTMIPSLRPPTTTATSTPSAIANTAANLRGGPGTNYAIVGAAKQGDLLHVIGRSGDWLQLASGAWIAASLVDDVPVVPSAVALPPTPAPPTVTPAIAIQPTAAPPPPARACCKHCGSTSKPCGNTCISLRFTCHVGVGCACP